MALPKKSHLEFRPGFREATRCSYWDYFIDGRRVADIFEVGDVISPFGCLDSEAELSFAEMLLLKRESGLRSNRIPLFVCPLCADFGCGVFTCEVLRVGEQIEWRNFGKEYDYDDSLIQKNDACRYAWFRFDIVHYERTFNRFLVGSA